MAVEKYPNNRMLGHREIVDGKVTLLLPEVFIFRWKSPVV
jgi:hypothetical protein